MTPHSPIASISRLAAPALLAPALLAGIALAAPATAEARGRCITRLPAKIILPSNYAVYYGRRMKVKVNSPRGIKLRHVRVALYTFSGRRIASGKRRHSISSTGTVNMKLFFGEMQAGKFTMIVTGEPNRSRSCGPRPTRRSRSSTPARRRCRSPSPTPRAGSPLTTAAFSRCR